MNILKITAITLAATLPGLASAQTAAPAAPATTSETPAYVNLINDDSITSRLEEAGYENVKITRQGSNLTIDATKEGAPTNLVYDLNTGTLTAVDGAGYEVPTAAPLTQGGDTDMGKSDQSDAGTPPSDDPGPNSDTGAGPDNNDGSAADSGPTN